MKYLLYKHVFCDGVFCTTQEAPDRCKSKTEAVVTFKEAFRHLLGRKPSDRQVSLMKTDGCCKAKSGCLEYRFGISKTT